MNDLYVLHDDNSSFADYSKESKDYLRDSYAVDFVALEDVFYIGLYKPFNSIYIELDIASAVDQQLDFKINNGTSDVTLEVDDDSKAFQRSGFIIWERDLEWEATEVNGLTQYWVKITAPADFTATIQGLNLVFSDDNDLSSEQPNIDRYIPVGKNSMINYHVASRNEIVQTIRNSGEIKEDANGDYENITQWDILDLGEIRQASKYLALAKINFDISENVDDKSYQRYNDYMAQYGSAFKLFWKSLDKNDDGKTEGEKVEIRSSELLRW